MIATQSKRLHSHCFDSLYCIYPPHQLKKHIPIYLKIVPLKKTNPLMNFLVYAVFIFFPLQKHFPYKFCSHRQGLPALPLNCMLCPVPLCWIMHIMFLYQKMLSSLDRQSHLQLKSKNSSNRKRNVYKSFKNQVNVPLNIALAYQLHLKFAGSGKKNTTKAN